MIFVPVRERTLLRPYFAHEVVYERGGARKQKWGTPKGKRRRAQLETERAGALDQSIYNQTTNN